MRQPPFIVEVIGDLFYLGISNLYVSYESENSLKYLTSILRIMQMNNVNLPDFQVILDCLGYQQLLRRNNIGCSMTNNGDPYENAVAERINGILKQEFMIDTFHQDLAVMKTIVKESINVYNNQRPHWSNHMPHAPTDARTKGDKDEDL